ncbi:MAG: c-type cytochrome, partial [Verrucomicrobiota bacterium]|nr:c-type cytochrome [Verrucomicrobiota bacterium]
EWKGAWRFSEASKLIPIASAGTGRSMPLSKGRSFDPVDIEIGPDKAIWISSWGRQYGAHYENGKLANEGRIYRIWPKKINPKIDTNKHRSKNINQWSINELMVDLGSHLPAWRTNAQEELIRRGHQTLDFLQNNLVKNSQNKSLETWTAWTIGRIKKGHELSEKNLNQKIQSIRIQTHNGIINPNFEKYLNHPNARIRHEAVMAIRQLKKSEYIGNLKNLGKIEKDRIVFYSIWGALMELCSESDLKHMLQEKASGLRLAALLALLEKDSLPNELVEKLCLNLVFTEGQDPEIVKIATSRSKGKAIFEKRGRPLSAEGSIASRDNSIVINPFSDLKASSKNNYSVDKIQLGNNLYSDRNFKFKEIPPILQNDAFIKTACDDAERVKNFELTFNLRYPSTLYLIDDSRSEKLPDWAINDWDETDLIVVSTEGIKMKIYEKKFPPGKVKLGPNRKAVSARKGNYLIAAKPNLLSKQEEKTTIESTLKYLSSADAKKGEDLFMSKYGANCSSCHQVSGKGNNHAPDLSDIGNRSDPRILAEAILNPSQSITEGFAAQMFEMKNGRIHTGIVLQETAREIQLAVTGGAVISVFRENIINRKGLPISAMPAIFSDMLNPQELAHIISYLVEQKKKQ